MNIRIGYEHPDSLITYPDAPFLSRCTDPIQKHGSYPEATPRTPAGPLVPKDLHPATATPGPAIGALPRRHARLAQPHLAQPAARKQRANTTHRQRANKTRPDHPVRARNVFGSGVRTLAVVRAVLTTIATLTTPLRHVILLGYVV